MPESGETRAVATMRRTVPGVSEGREARSLSFDRAAEYYDRTRAIDPEALAETVAMLAETLSGRDPVLEIGVGTGVIALPLSEAGVRLVGLDLSRPMLAKLVEKAGRPPLPLVQGDAVRLPFSDGTFGGAYARWVLHLIPAWRSAVAELVRVVRPGGALVIEPGGYSGVWREVWLKFIEEGGDAIRSVGLDMTDDSALDLVLSEAGVKPSELPPVRMKDESTLEEFFDQVGQRLFSWTWRIADEDFERVVNSVRAWARERFGPLDVPIRTMYTMPRWRMYELPGV